MLATDVSDEINTQKCKLWKERKTENNKQIGRESWLDFLVQMSERRDDNMERKKRDRPAMGCEWRFYVRYME